jgi:hypothetical protein
LFEFARMAFGLCNSPATYTRVINLVLRGLNCNKAYPYTRVDLWCPPSPGYILSP